MPRNSQAASAKRRVARIHSASTRPGDQRADREREGDREQRVPRVEHRRVDHHPRVAQQRVQARRPRPAPARRRSNGDAVKTSSAGEEGAEAEQHGGRVRRDVAQAAAREEQDEARPERQQPAATAAASPPARTTPRRTGSTSGVVVDECAATTAKREVRRAGTRSRGSANATVVTRGQRVERAARPRRPSSRRRGARAVRARRRRRRAQSAERDDQAGLAEDGHRVRTPRRSAALVGELRRALGRPASPSRRRTTLPLLAHVHDDLAPVAERVGHGAGVARPARTRVPSRSRTRKTDRRCRVRVIEPSTTLPVSW